MRNLTVTALVGLLGLSCVPPKTADEAQAERKAEYEAANRERERYAADRERREREAGESKRVALEAEDKRRRDAELALVADRARKRASAEEDSCASDRAQRLEEVKRRDDSIAHVNELIQWEIDHCKWVDASKPVTRVVQDSRGEYHTVAGRDRGVDRVCDAKLPAEIAKGPADKLPTYQMPKAVEKRVEHCASWDEKASTAK